MADEDEAVPEKVESEDERSDDDDSAAPEKVEPDAETSYEVEIAFK